MAKVRSQAQTPPNAPHHAASDGLGRPVDACGRAIARDRTFVSVPDTQANPVLQHIRGASDAASLGRRYTDRALHQAYRPPDPQAAAAFDALEQARCEALGVRTYRGIRHNLQGLHTHTCHQDRSPEPLLLDQSLAWLARERWFDCSPPAKTSGKLKPWRKKLKHVIADLDDVIDDQQQFAQRARDLIDSLEAGRDDNADAPPEDQEDTPEDQLAQAPEDHDDGQQDTTSARTSPEGAAQIEKDQQERSETPAGESPPRPRAQSLGTQYRIFTTEFDRVIDADKLASDRAQAASLRKELDIRMAPLKGVMTKLANRLQRLLLSQQNHSWTFDLEEGLLDAARLPRVIIDPTNPLSFKRERRHDFRDTVVSLLIDNSGSMRGRPISVAAISADLLARTLERCGVAVEVLGFTTGAWKGGRVRQLWNEEAQDGPPGRLNELLHVIYKKADEPWRRARQKIALMLIEGLLKENIDGEALLWAYQRLCARPESRRILMVISDGAPVDDSTNSANPPGYLEAHLRRVIKDIQNDGVVELLAIGVGHDVTDYYDRAITIIGVDELAKAMVEQCADLFAA
ncbi:MAG: cobaltochelatase subunit CobT [Pseudomonadota bacterium]